MIFIKSLAVMVLAICSLTACTSMQSNIQSSSSMTQGVVRSMHTLPSKYGFDETVSRLKSAFESRGMTIFAVIDHQGAAKGAGLSMQPATVIIYGTPKAGTPLMKKDPTFALQLPLKVLVSEYDDQVQVSYVPASKLVDGTKINTDDTKDTLAKAEMLIQKIVSE